MAGRSWSRDRRGSLRPRSCGPRAPKPGAAGLNVLSFNGDELMAMSSSVTLRSVRYVSSSRVHCTEPRIIRGTSGSRVPRGCPDSCCSTMRGASSSDSPPVDTFPSLHSSFWLSVNLAKRAPVILAIDERHWIDGESLRRLRFLAGLCRRCHLRLVTRRAHGYPSPEALIAMAEAIMETDPSKCQENRSNGENTRLYPTSSRPSNRGLSRAS